jgi:hypothetical protein
MPETGSPIVIESGAAESNELPATPADGGVQPPAPNGLDAAPPKPELPLSRRQFPPMANAKPVPQPKFQRWPPSIERVPKPAHSRVAAAGETALPFVGEKAPGPVESQQSTLVTDQATTARVSEREWKVVVHDAAVDAAGSSRDDAARFPPPSVEGNPSEEAPGRAPDDSQQSLEEKTGNALRQFMAVDGLCTKTGCGSGL